MQTRRVRRLSLQATAEADVQPMVTQITDALHTASLPFADTGVLVVIRRLALGKLSPGGSRAAIAMRIEAVVRELTATAVRSDDPAAAEAAAVIFPHRSEALAVLGRLHARRAGTDAWFWPAVVPGWQTAAGREHRWAMLMSAVHALPAPALTASGIVAEAVRCSTADELLATLRPGNGATWIRFDGWVPAHTIRPHSPTLGKTFPDFRTIACVQRWRQIWGDNDDRLVWLATMLVLDKEPFRITDTALPSEAVASLTAAANPDLGTLAPRTQASASPSNDIENLASPSPLRSEPASAEVTFIQQVATTAESAAVAKNTQYTPSTASACEPPVARVEHASEVPSIAKQSAEYTPVGGLLFLTNVLHRLSFGKFMEDSPGLTEQHFPARLLQSIAYSAGAEANDRLLNELLRIQSNGLIEGEPELRAWRGRIRQWCRRQARMGLIGIVRRPARVIVSRAHVDVCFPISQSDIRIRRAGLDIDPGWVPWLGLLIQFHYIDPNEYAGLTAV